MKHTMKTLLGVLLALALLLSTAPALADLYCPQGHSGIAIEYNDFLGVYECIECGTFYEPEQMSNQPPSVGGHTHTWH